MKVYYIGVHKKEDKESIELAKASDLSEFNYFIRSQVGNLLSVFTGTAAARTPPGKGLQIEQEALGKQYVFHTFSHRAGITAVVITDKEYPGRIALSLAMKVADEFTAKYPASAYANITQASLANNPNPLPYPELNALLTKYQNPDDADNISKIQKELDETMVIVHKTLDSVLERGEKIDSLVQKSDALSSQSKMFYTQAKKQNSCCVVM